MVPAQSDTLLKISPKGALLRSAFIPGWGQVYNRKPIKGLLFLAAESYFTYNFIHYNKLYSYVKTTKETLGVDAWVGLSESQKQDSIFSITGKQLSLNSWRPREIRNKYAWWCVGNYIICLMDAVVDAHLINFPKDAVELTMDGITLKYTFNLGK
jgi:hypothetical protein